MNHEERASIYGKLSLASLLYAILFGFILRTHLAGVGMTILALTTVVYCVYCMKLFARKVKAGTFVYMAYLLLLGLSTSMTGNTTIQLLNGFLFFILLVNMQLHIYHDDRQWTLAKNFLMFFRSLAGCFECIGDFFIDRHCKRTQHRFEKRTKLTYVLLGIVISVPLLAILIALLSQADAMFSMVIKDIFGKHIRLGKWAKNVFVSVLVFFAAYTGVRFHIKRRLTKFSPDLRTFDPIVANTILSLVSVVYLAFCGIQVFYLFIGKGTLPADYTYATYAREGFFQLLAVSIINLVLVLLFIGIFRSNRLMKFLLAMISICTYIMLASSAFRMCMYIKVYHLTFTRVFVLWALLLLALALLGLLIAIFNRNFRLVRYWIVLCGLCYILFSFSRPDYWIAKYNINAIPYATEEVDLEYLTSLSSDAAPVIAHQKEKWTDTYKKKMQEQTKKHLLDYNLSINRAQDMF